MRSNGPRGITPTPDTCPITLAKYPAAGGAPRPGASRRIEATIAGVLKTP